MKKILLIVLCAVALQLHAQEQLPKWLSDLQTLNPGLIDSIHYYAATPKAPDTRTYVIYYNQPLKHSQSGSAHFPLRALITVYKNADPTTAVNHVYASGYSLMGDFLANPDASFAAGNNCVTEIAHRYNANFIQIEHRYFQQSAPQNCWTNLDDLRAEEAAADFHNLFEGFKKVLKGKFVMSGVSKGGITTLLQHRFYPNDMDIYVPYSAPFFNTDRDTTMQQYWYTNGWNKEYLDMFMNIRRSGIYRRDNIFPAFLKMRGSADTKAAQDSVYWYYLSEIAVFGYQEHAYGDTASIRYQMYRNDSIMEAKHVQAYGDTVYAFMFDKSTFNLDQFPQWLDTLRKYPEPNQAPRFQRRQKHIRPFGITYNQWWGNDSVDGAAYVYQAKRELGYFDYRFDLIIEDAAQAAEYNNYWKQQTGCLIDLESPFFRNLSFSADLYDATMTATQNATKPIVLIYGLDDAWTGGAVKDQFVNGTNVKKFILPAQNHMAFFSSNTDKAMCDAIRAMLDAALAPSQDLDDPIVHRPSPTRKFLRDGHLLIERDGRIYNVQGVEVK